jgi:hypothetical protein
MKIFIMLSILFLFSSCSKQYPRLFIYTPNNNITTDQDFEKKSESYGAYYIKQYMLMEYAKYQVYEYYTFFTVHNRLKILNEAGYKYARIEIPKSETIIQFDLVVENKLGEKRKVKFEDLILVKNSKESFSLHNDYYIYSIPNIESGSIIDILYVVRFDYPVLSKRFNVLPDLPVFQSDVNVATISDWKTRILTYNNLADPVVKTFKENKTLYSWYLDKIFPLKEESYQEPIYRVNPYFTVVIEKIKKTFSSYKPVLNWSDINKIYFKVSESSYLKGSFIEEELNKIKEKYENTNAENIYKYMQDEYKLGFSYKPQYIVKYKEGSVYGLSLLAYMLLEEAGLDPSYIALRSFDTGNIDFKNPSEIEYDAVVPVVNGLPLFVFNKSYPYGKIPYYFEGTKAVHLLKDTVSEVSILNSDISENTAKINYDIILYDNDIVINQKDEFTGHLSFDKKSVFNFLKLDSTKELEKEFLDDILEERDVRYEIEKYKVLNVEKPNKNLIIYYKIKYPDLIKTIANEKILNLDRLIFAELNKLIDMKSRAHNFYFQHAQIYEFSIKLRIDNPNLKHQLSELKDLNFENKYFIQKFDYVKNPDGFSLKCKVGIKEKLISKEDKILVQDFAEKLNKLRSIKVLITK